MKATGSLAEMKKSPIDDPLFGHVVVRADGRATHAMYVFKVKAPQQSKSRYDVYDLIETIPPESRLPAARPGRLPAREVTAWSTHCCGMKQTISAAHWPP